MIGKNSWNVKEPHEMVKTSWKGASRVYGYEEAATPPPSMEFTGNAGRDRVDPNAIIWTHARRDDLPHDLDASQVP